MSEFQYYEFQALERSLDSQALQELRRISSRAEISCSRFSVIYNWSDLSADPWELLGRYFDAHFYTSNFGTHFLAFRFPKSQYRSRDLEPYWVSEWLFARTYADSTLVIFERNHDDAGPELPESETWLGDLSVLRNDILSGDCRSLYLGWLRGLQAGALDPEDTVPPCPPGLETLTPALQRLVQFLELDPFLLAAAQAASPRREEPSDDPVGLQTFVRSLSTAEKESWLLQLLEGKLTPAMATAQLQRQWRQSLGGNSQPESVLLSPATLLAQASQRRQQHREQEAARQAAAQAHSEAAAARAQQKRLQQLKQKGESVWQEVDALMASKKPANYTIVISTLQDLKVLARQEQWSPLYRERIQALMKTHSRKYSLIDRLYMAQLDR